MLKCLKNRLKTFSVVYKTFNNLNIHSKKNNGFENRYFQMYTLNWFQMQSYDAYDSKPTGSHCTCHKPLVCVRALALNVLVASVFVCVAFATLGGQYVAIIKCRHATQRWKVCYIAAAGISFWWKVRSARREN